MRLVRLFYLVGLTVAAAGCGGDGQPPGGPDAAVERRQLRILEPPGDQIGLPFGGTAELRVRYEDATGATPVPLPGAAVVFAIVAGQDPTEDPAGSSLAQSSVTTDEAGIARVEVTAGASRTRFRVKAEAAGAAGVTFYIVVSDQGFVTLEVTPRHVGPRPADHFTAVEVRVYGSPRACAELDAAAPPASPYPPRSMAAFDAVASYFLPAGERYAVLAWGRDEAPHVLADGCVDLLAEQTVAGATLKLDVAAEDRPTALAASYAVSSELNLGPVAELVFADRLGWGVAACPAGPAQLVLDCALDALDGGDAEDCVVEAPGAIASALEAARGPVDAAGCRGGGGPDAALFMALTAGGDASAGARFAAEATALGALLGELALASSLEPAGATAVHALGVAGLGAFGLDLQTTARPIVTANGVALALGEGTIMLGTHGYTLRLGSLLEAAFIDQVLEPAGVTAAPDKLGELLLADARSGMLAGCAAVSDAACVAAGLPADCLAAACPASGPALNALLASPFVRLDGAGLDLAWSGAANVIDDDHDLLAEALAGGVWVAEVTLADGTLVALTGGFAAVAP